jgi:predicted tellurium resistance membrane protein TerC
VNEKSALFKSLLIETIVYSVIVLAYVFLVLRFLGGWLVHLFQQPDKVPYAFIALLLMIGQGVALEVVTSALLRFIRRRTG